MAKLSKTKKALELAIEFRKVNAEKKRVKEVIQSLGEKANEFQEYQNNLRLKKLQTREREIHNEAVAYGINNSQWTKAFNEALYHI